MRQQRRDSSAKLLQAWEKVSKVSTMNPRKGEINTTPKKKRD
jgi:hypothetical protein